MSDAPISFRLWKPDDSILEIGAKASATFTLVALGTAFVYDAIYYNFLDARLLSSFVLADHIETAIFCVPWVLLGVAAYVLLFPLTSLAAVHFSSILLKRHGLKAQRRFHSSLKWLVFGIAVVLLFSTSDALVRQFKGTLLPGDRTSLEAISGFAMAWLGMLYLTVEIQSASIRRMIFLEIVVLGPIIWFMATVYFAVTSSVASSHNLAEATLVSPDKVTMADQGQLVGRVIRLVDKGVILGVTGPDRFIFIPKDKVIRIDLAARSGR